LSSAAAAWYVTRAAGTACILRNGRKGSMLLLAKAVVVVHVLIQNAGNHGRPASIKRSLSRTSSSHIRWKAQGARSSQVVPACPTAQVNQVQSTGVRPKPRAAEPQNCSSIVRLPGRASLGAVHRTIIWKQNCVQPRNGAAGTRGGAAANGGGSPSVPLTAAAAYEPARGGKGRLLL